MIPRQAHLAAVERLLKRNPVVALLGARQVGKSTLAREVARRFSGPHDFLDLEAPESLRALSEPASYLSEQKGLVVLDEVQRRPELFPVLRVLADRPGSTRFLVLGSASPELLRQSSESLAGRIAFHHLPPLSLGEVGANRQRRLWLRGGFPRSFTAHADADSAAWRRDFVRTFLERDLPQLGVRVPGATLARFWAMLAHVHGQVLNWSELGRSMGVSDTTIRHYVDLLAQSFVVRLLPPWHENLSKRQVKSPKVYVSDSGIVHSLLDIDTYAGLQRHPKCGASFEGHCLEQVVQRLGARRDQCFFWATQSGAELDLLVLRDGSRRGFEVKYSDAPTLTPSMRHALEDLRLDSLEVLYPGSHTYSLHERVRAVPIARLLLDVDP
ncbi:MAG: ATP-binding protein [Myxococcales bacterium]|nr:ATP-binding protein [Myxococcales bacterium]